MAISLSSLGTNVTAGGTTCSVASITPTGSVVLVAITVYVGTSTNPSVSSVTGCGLTWTSVTSVNWDSTGTDRSTTFLYKGLGTPSSGTITVTIAASSDFTIHVIDVTGADGTTPIVQSATQINGSGTTPITVTLAAFADATNNVAFGVWGLQNSTANTVTPGSGFTEIAETNQGFAHQSTEWKTGQDTSVDFSNSGGTLFRNGALAVEIAVAASGTQTVNCQVITASSTLLSPALDYNVELNVITASSTILSPGLAYKVALGVINATSTILSPSVAPGPVSVVAPLLDAASIVLNAGLEAIIQLAVIGTTSTLFDPSLDYNIVADVLNTTATVFQPLLMDNIDMQVLNVTSTMFSPEINQDIVTPSISATSTVNNMDVVGGGGSTSIDSLLITTTSTLFEPTTKSTINTPVIAVPSTVNDPSFKYIIGLQVVTTASTIFSPSLEYLIELQTVNTAPTVLAPRVGEPPPDDGQRAIVKTSSPSPFPIGI